MIIYENEICPVNVDWTSDYSDLICGISSIG